MSDMTKPAEFWAEKLAAIRAADTPENFKRLKRQVSKMGWRLTKTGSSVSGYRVTLRRGDAIEGVTLADVADMAARRPADRQCAAAV